MSIGSPTASHPDLTVLAVGEVREGLVASRRKIGEPAGRVTDLVCYPKELSDDVILQEARDAGYCGGVTLCPGIVRAGGNPLRLFGINVAAGISPEALESWAAGLRVMGEPSVTRESARRSGRAEWSKPCEEGEPP